MAKVDGSETLSLSRERVWALLNDPEVLGAAIPGCHGLEREEGEEHRYLTAIAVAIGAVKGVYEGTVLYADIEEPERCTIKVSGRGDKGTIEGQGKIELRAAGDQTEVAYRGEFKLTGPVAGIGQRLAPGVSRKMIIETLRNLERSGAPPEPAAPGAVESPAAEGAGDGSPTPAAGMKVAGEPSSSTREVEPFDPVPAWVRPAGLLALGLVVGFVIGRVL
ncbi:MAG: hypothetical protein EDQ89_02430 [Acidobacteria bacterium]|nr:MAG: hypothetical protein EDQ89_02430 [Acidobacteriota bacterium]